LAGFPRILFGKGLYGTEKVQAGVKQEKIQNADAGEREGRKDWIVQCGRVRNVQPKRTRPVSRTCGPQLSIQGAKVRA
jgi:hypothetical protein